MLKITYINFVVAFLLSFSVSAFSYNIDTEENSTVFSGEPKVIKVGLSKNKNQYQDNSFIIDLPFEFSKTQKAILTYEYKGLQNASGVAYSLNKNLSIGGYLSKKDTIWKNHSEFISIKQLIKGENEIFFSKYDDSKNGYEIKNVKIEIIDNNSVFDEIEITQALNNDSLSYIKGIIANPFKQLKSIEINGNEVINNNGAFEWIGGHKKDKFLISLNFTDGSKKEKSIVINDIVLAGYVSIENRKKSKTDIKVVDDKRVIFVEGATLVFDENELNLKNSIIPLEYRDLPQMKSDMRNLTANAEGFRVNNESVERITLKIPYDVKMMPSGYGPHDLSVFFYSTNENKWTSVPVDSINTNNHYLVATVEESSDYITGVIQAPESATTSGYAPTTFNDLAQANPMADIQLMSAPTPNNMGDANLGYQIVVPQGRQGIQPNLAISYNSEGTNGLLGVGWNLPIPSIEIDTRWGAPRFDPSRESETYICNGEQLIFREDGISILPHREDDEVWGRIEDRQFYKRRNSAGGFSRIIRLGSSSSTYYWEVTDAAGIRYYYGGNEDGIIENAILRNGNGDVTSWKLSHVVDMYGNYMNYNYQQEASCASCPAGIVWNLRSIDYTGNNGVGIPIAPIFQVQFFYEERLDILSSARNTAMEVFSNRLKNVLVFNEGAVFRDYEFNYITGPYGKSLLESIMHNGEDEHVFDYYDVPDNKFTNLNNITIQDLINLYLELVGFPSWATNNFFDNFRYSAINTNTSKGGSAGVYIGIGLDNLIPDKSGTLGPKFSFSYQVMKGKTTLVDVNGDGLADRVYKDDGFIYYYPNISRNSDGFLYQGDGSDYESEIFDFANPIQITGGPDDFLLSESYGLTLGLQINTPGAAGNGAFNENSDYTKTYFTEVNGDGLIDLVVNGIVYFNNDNPDVPHLHGFTKNLDDLNFNKLVSNQIEPEVYTVDEINSLICDNPLADIVKMWEAPFSGEIEIPTLIEYVGNSGDNVNVSIEQINMDSQASSLIFETLLTDDLVDINIGNINVNKGDLILFRVNSGIDNSMDENNLQTGSGVQDIVEWNPHINYLNTDLSNVPLVDNYEKSIVSYNYANDFVASQLQSNQIYVEADQTYNLEGIISSISPLAYPLTLQATFSNFYVDEVANDIINGTTVIETFSMGDLTSEYNLNLPLTTDPQVTGVIIEIEILTDNGLNVEWSQISSNFNLTLNDEIVNADLAVNYKFYNQVDENEITTLSLSSEDIIKIDELIINDVDETYEGNYSQDLFISILDENSILIDQKSIDIVIQNNGSVNIEDSLFPLEFEIENQGEYSLVLSSDLSFLEGNIQPITTLLLNDEEIVYSPSMWSYDDALRSHFGNLYRGWGTFVYSPNVNETENLIDYSSIQFNSDPNKFDDLNNGPDEVNFDLCDFDYFQLTLKMQEDEFVWCLTDSIFASATKSKSARIGNQILIETPNFDDVYKAPRLVSRTTALAGGATLGGGVDIGINFSNGDSRKLKEYFDLNGDRIPDIFGSRIQYSHTNGRLDPSASQNVSFTNNLNNSLGIAVGGELKFATDDKNSEAAASNSETTSSNAIVLDDLGISTSINESVQNAYFQDINGDNLPDRVFIQGSDVFVAYNLGYGFSSELHSISTPRDLVYSHITYDLPFAISIGFSISNGSFKGGFSSGLTESRNISQLIDINADGLVDLLLNTGEVFLNIGGQFIAGEDLNFDVTQSINSIDLNHSIGLSGNGAFTIYVPASGSKIAITPQFSASLGMSKKTVAYIDIDGDGLPDFLRNENTNEPIQIRKSRLGKVNKLRNIIGPLGHSITLDYNQTAATYEHPGGKWVMSSVVVDDGFEGDGVDELVTTFNYRGGVYDRCEREFYGFREMVINDPEKRLVNRYNTEYYPRGTLINSKLGSKDNSDDFSIDELYSETITEVATREVLPQVANNYTINDLGYGLSSDLSTSLSSIGITTVERQSTYLFEGGDVPYLASDAIMEYDELGRVTNYFNTIDGELLDATGDEISGFRYKTDIIYEDDFDNNVFALPTSSITMGISDVDESAPPVELRSSVAVVIANKNRYESITEGGIATSDFIYNEYGNLMTSTFPEDMEGNRPNYDYVYEEEELQIHTITDHFGNTTKFENWDHKFGVFGKQIDINENEISFTYDSRGRVKTITAPGQDSPAVFFTYDKSNLITNHAAATTERVDPDNQSNFLKSIIHTDGLGRNIQAIADAEINDVELTIKSGVNVYDALGRVTTSFMPSIGLSMDDYTLDVSNQTDVHTAITYDILSRPLSQTVLGVTTDNEYDLGTDHFDDLRLKTTSTILDKETEIFSKAGGLITSTKSDIIYQGSIQEMVTFNAYDGINQLLKTTTMNGLSPHEFSYTYDILGRAISKNIPDMDPVTLTYDALSNVIKRETGSGETNYIYDRERLMSINYDYDSDDNDHDYTYDVSYVYGAFDDDDFNRKGRLIEINDAAGKQEFWYDVLGNIRTERRTIPIPFKTDAATFVTQYEYDLWNRLQTMIYPDGEVLTYGYDKGGQLERLTGEKDGFDYLYISNLNYDEFSQRTFVSMGDNISCGYEYEADTRWLHNLTSEGAGGMIQDLIYGYDQVGNITSLNNNASVSGSERLGGTTSFNYSYDSHFRLKEAEGTWTGGNFTIEDDVSITKSATYIMELEYDVIGNIQSKTYNRSLTDEKHSFGFSSQDEIIYNYNYEVQDEPIYRNHINTLTQTHHESFGTDDQNNAELSSFNATHNYNFSNGGNTTNVLKDISQITPASDYKTDRKMTYDIENRLLEVNDDGLISHYFYDSGGNRILKLTQERHKIYTNGALSDGFVEPQEFVLYVNPYLVVRDNFEYTKHIYAGSEKIVSKIGSNVYYQNNDEDEDEDEDEEDEDEEDEDDEEMIEIIDPSELPEIFGIDIQEILNVKASMEFRIAQSYEIEDLTFPYVFEGETTQSLIIGGGEAGEETHQYFLLKDHLGSSSFVVDREGVVLQHIEYSAFGESFVDQRNTSYSTPWKYNGKEQDCETGLYYYGARFYDPAVGRFLTVDALADHPNQIDKSVYAYAWNNPIILTDPDGNCPWCVLPWIGETLLGGGLATYFTLRMLTDGINDMNNTETQTRSRTNDKTDDSNIKIYRNMNRAKNWPTKPQLGSTKKSLGVKVAPVGDTWIENPDIRVDREGMVHPGTGGMSVNYGTKEGLAEYRRSKTDNGTSNAPDWYMNAEYVSERTYGLLQIVLNPSKINPNHAVIEPVKSMDLETYIRLLESLQYSFEEDK